MKRFVLQIMWLVVMVVVMGTAEAKPFTNDIALPSQLYMLKGVRNEVFVHPFLKRWRPYDDFVRFELKGGDRTAFLRRLSSVATVTNPVEGAKLEVSLVNGDEFETVKTLSPVLRAATPGVGDADVYAQIVGDSLTHGGFYRGALVDSGYVPKLHLVGLRRLTRAEGKPAQYYEGRGGWRLDSYFTVPKGERTSYHGFMQPKDGRYWGDTSFWKMCWRCVRKTQPKGFQPTYSCEEFGDAAAHFDEQTGFLKAPQAGDVQFDAEKKQMVRWDGSTWQPVDEKSLDFGFDYGKYLAMWGIRAPQFLFVYLGCNDFYTSGLTDDFQAWKKMITTFKESYAAAVPNGKFVVALQVSSVGLDDNKAGEFAAKVHASLWRFRDWAIKTFDNREAEGWYLLDGGICMDNDHGFALVPPTDPLTETFAKSPKDPYLKVRDDSPLRVQMYNPHAYSNYPVMGVPFAAFIQYHRGPGLTNLKLSPAPE